MIKLETIIPLDLESTFLNILVSIFNKISKSQGAKCKDLNYLKFEDLILKYPNTKLKNQRSHYVRSFTIQTPGLLNKLVYSRINVSTISIDYDLEERSIFLIDKSCTDDSIFKEGQDRTKSFDLEYVENEKIKKTKAYAIPTFCIYKVKFLSNNQTILTILRASDFGGNSNFLNNEKIQKKLLSKTSTFINKFIYNCYDNPEFISIEKSKEELNKFPIGKLILDLKLDEKIKIMLNSNKKQYNDEINKLNLKMEEMNATFKILLNKKDKKFKKMVKKFEKIIKEKDEKIKLLESKK
jgi:hypothetical protein